MRFTLLAVTGLGLMGSVCVGADAPLVYELEPVFESGIVKAIAVDLRFKAGATGETILELPQKWGGQDKLYEALDGFVVRGKRTSIAPGAEPWQRILRHAPGAAVRLRYLVNHADPGPTRNGNPYRPFVLPERVQLLGATVFAAPAGVREDQPVEIHFRNFPKSWSFASDLERSPLTYRDLMESITVAGDFRVLTRQVRGAPLRIAMNGQWPFTDDYFADTLASIAGAQYDFWRERAQPYVVTLLQTDGPTSGGGTGRGAGFAMFATPDFSPRDMIRALAHEMLHHWIPRRLGELPAEHEGEALEYWLSEGFSDYYTLRLLVNAGVWSAADFATALNVALKRYAGSPVRNAPNTRIAAEFWADSNVGQLPYDRGLLFAIYVDSKLRGASNGVRTLDDVMRAMRGRFDRTPGPIRDAFVDVVAEYGVDVRRELADSIDAGGDITLDADTFMPCGTVTSEDLPVFHRGFDVEATTRNQMRISGVDPELPAFRAGLRDGMTLLAREFGTVGDATQEIGYRVSDQGVVRVIRYLPQGHGTARTQSLRLRTDLDTAHVQACARRLGAG